MSGRYEILHKMAEGGMGSIYQVRHRLLDVVRVAKVLRPQLASKEEWRNRFLSEARLASRLNHPAIAHLHDFEVDSDGAWMIMEYIRGYDLATILKHCGKPSVGLAVTIARQGLDALAYIHQAKLVHRDISPDNLMIARGHEGGPELKLIDLGIAKRLGEGGGSSTVVGTFLGKYQYSSPEQLESAASVDYRSDIYSFGLVLYELLTGFYAFKGETAQELAAAHWFQPPRDFSETDPEGRIPEQLKNVVLASLEKDPSDRISTAREFGQALADFALPLEETAAELDAVFETCAGVMKSPDEAQDETIAGTQNRLDRVFGVSQSSTSDGEETPQQRAAVLLALAQGEMAVGDWNAAVTRLNQAAQLDSESTEIQDALAEAEKQAAREAQLNVAIDKIENLLTAGDLDEASRRLASAEHSLGDAARLDELRRKLEESLEDRESRVSDLLARAAGMRDRGSLEAGIELVENALEIDAGSAAARKLKRDLHQDLVRQQSLTDSLAAVDKEVDSGNLEKAGDLLRRIESTFGETPGTKGLWARIESGRTSAAASLIARARRQVAHQNWSEAKEALEQALRFDTGNAEAQALLGEADAGAAREARARYAADTVESLIEAGKLDQASQYFSEHADELEGFPQRATLDERLQVAFRERDEQVDRLVRQAERMTDSGELEEALDTLRRARDLDPERSDVQEKRAELKRLLATQRVIESVVVTVRELVEAGDLEDASSTLAAAEEQHGKDELLTGLRSEIDRLQKRAREHELTTILAGAQELKAAGEWEAAARSLREALQLDAGNRTARQQLADVESEIERESSRRDALNQIGAMLEEGRADDARARLEETVTLLGSSPELENLADRIEAAFERRGVVESHLSRAGDLERQGDYRAAILELVEAQKIDPKVDVDDFMSDLRELEARGRKIGKLARRAEMFINREDFEDAKELLEKSRQEFGDEAALMRAWQRLADARKQAHQSRVADLVHAAESWREAGDLKLALSTIRDAVEIDASNEQAQALLREIEQEIDQRQQSRQEITEKLELLELGIDDQVRRSAEVSQRHHKPRSSRRWLIVAAIVVIAGAAAGLGWKYLWWSGSLAIEPSPEAPGLSIWIGGEDSGAVTPAEIPLQGQTGSSVEITLKRDQESPVASRSFVLGPEMESTWEPAVPVVRRIASQPTGARVAIDGVWLDEVTPVELEIAPDLDAVHEIRLELEGYQPRVSEVTLNAWGDELEMTLEEFAKPGTLVVRAPYEVEVKVAGQTATGRTHEFTLPAGRHQVELSAADLFFFRRQTVTIESEQQFDLTSFPGTATVWVFAVPGNASLSIDGRRVGDLPRELTVSTGRHRLEFTWPDSDFADTVEVTEATTKVSSDATQIVVD
jgi:tetratricopeptide (TPR) repeat protein/tRNA A-37 threonylcarbamoyl transferase component Bud32